MATAGPLAGTGLPPDPKRFPDWREYGAALSTFMAGQAQVTKAVQPQAVQLVHTDTQGAGVPARALEDGILVYDPSWGLMISIGGTWQPILAGAAFGGMRLNPATAPIAGANITTAWQTVTQFDQQHLPHTAVTIDPVANSFTFTRSGVYFIAANLQLSHNNSGSARNIDLRFTFSGVPFNSVAFRTPVAPTTTATIMIVVTSFYVPPALVGTPGIVEVSAPSGDITTVQWRVVNLTLQLLAPITPGVIVP